MRTHDQRGSLLVAMLFSLALLAIVLSLLSLSTSSFRLTARNEYRAQARAVAESELEHLFYLYKDKASIDVKAIAAVASDFETRGLVDNATTPTTARLPYLSIHRDAGWTVRRSMHDSASFNGYNSTGRYGDAWYTDVRIEVIPPVGSPWQGQTFRVARQFSAASSVVFQGCIFYQGDLEFAPGGDTTITGSILSNGSVYMGASSGGSLTLKGTVTYLKGYGFNTDPGFDGKFGTGDDGTLYSTYRKPGTPAGGTLTAPTFYYSQAQQLKIASQESNFIGGLDAVALQKAKEDLFPTVNDVYRSVIVPPPSADNDNEYTSPGSLTDSLAVGTQRAYNKADLIVTVSESGTVTVADKSGTDVTMDYTSAVTLASKDVYDMREGRNVAITEIDVGTLKTALTGKTFAGKPFNGIVYVNLKKGTASNPAAVRLVNGKDLPVSGDGDGGFSLVTNGGLYVQGDYNTTKLPDGSTAKALLMADAMTVLSKEWDDTNAANTDVTARKAKTDLTINSALLVGTTPASSTEFSGGAQNIVRYLEDWGYDADSKTYRNVTFNGSFGRLFDSKMMCRPWKQPGTIYVQPKLRNYNFDEGLREDGGPPGSVPIVNCSRGRYSQW